MANQTTPNVGAFDKDFVCAQRGQASGYTIYASNHLCSHASMLAVMVNHAVVLECLPPQAIPPPASLDDVLHLYFTTIILPSHIYKAILPSQTCPKARILTGVASRC